MNRERRSFLGLLAPAVLALPGLSAGGGSASQRPSAGQGRTPSPSPKETNEGFTGSLTEWRGAEPIQGHGRSACGTCGWLASLTFH